MAPLSRRQFIGDITLAALTVLVLPPWARAASGCPVPHPLSPPDPVLHGRCPNCGMGRSMWARTWKTFRIGDRTHDACSFHCLVDMAVKSGESLQAVKTALFLQPRGMVQAESAWYVAGSSAKGTMTMVSKAAFAGRSAAEDFTRLCGGEIMEYAAVYRLAASSLALENDTIDQKRLTGKAIVPPVDMHDECVVCRMYPARYPLHRSQVSFRDGHIDHFCSTHCLFVWLGQAGQGKAGQDASGMIWVTDFATGRWISGRTAFYVVDSGFMGPMGAEAIAFDRQSQARAFVREKGGRVMGFDRIRTGPASWTMAS